MKNLIKKYLLKHLTNRKYRKHYYFYRWLVELVKDEESTKHVLHSIAYSMSELNLNLPFEDIFVINDTFFILTPRPGLWIGRKGSVIDSIRHRINYKVDGTKIFNYDVEFLESKNTATIEVLSYLHHLQNNY